MTPVTSETPDRERNLGPQPVGAVIEELQLTPHDLVAASPRQLTHKLIQRAIKGRWLTKHSRTLVQQALHAASGRLVPMNELFNYR